MGNPTQFSKISSLPDPAFALFDSATYFIDIDGVLLSHNRSVHGNYPWDEDSPILENTKQVRELFDVAKIIIVSARPKKYETELKMRLDYFGIPYDELLMGCTGGQRFLVNDLKPRAPFIPTANAINTVRDAIAPIIQEEKKYLNISGGSGALSVLIENEYQEHIVVKCTQDSQRASILKYQASWFKHVRQFENIRVPNLLNVFDGKDGIYGYSTTKIDRLISLSAYRENTVTTEKLIQLIQNGLGPLYAACNYPEFVSPNLNEDIVSRKVIPSIQTSILWFEEYPRLKEILLELLNEFTLVRVAAKSEEMLFKGPQALIHGDPTFENLQVDLSSSEIVLLDPVGKMIEPRYDPSRFSAESYPVFDLARLELSFKLNYEKHMKISQDNDLDWDECEFLGITSLDNPSICTTNVLRIYENFGISNLNLVLATTIGRILKYKSNPKEVFILANQCLGLIKSIKNS
jgi:hypothetical protein